MSWVVETILKAHNWYNGVNAHKATLQKDSSPVQIGVLSAAGINPVAIFDPISTHSSTILHSVAARSITKAQAQIQYYNLAPTKPGGSYEDLLADPTITAAYIPLPNSLHSQWTISALRSGKHVLVEKPIASNVDEIDSIIQAAQQTGKVVLEAFHWRLHPAAHLVHSIVHSGQYGTIKSVDAKFMMSAGILAADDIRLNYDLSGGCCMDFIYVFSAVNYFANKSANDPDSQLADFEVLNATARVNQKDARIDQAMKATILFKSTDNDTQKQNDITTTIEADLAYPRLWGLIPQIWKFTPLITIELDRAQVTFPNFVGPWANHTITIRERDATTGSFTGVIRREKCYQGGPAWGEGKGQDWWTSYRYQLEAFVGKVKEVEGGEKYDGPWIGLGESRKVMEIVEGVYAKAGLPRRGTKA